MSTMEHLFMQIFERKNWIEDQLKQQIESYGQSLASNVLADGGRPPPWLWTTGSDGLDCPDAKELNREQLISGILFPLPRATTPSANHKTLFHLPTLNGDFISQSDSFFSETCISNKYFDIDDRYKAVPNNYHNGNQQDPVMMVESEVVEVSAEVDPLASFQRSRSRQRDLEIRLGKKVKSTTHPHKERTADKYTGRMTRSRAAPLQPSCVKEPLGRKNSSVFCNGDGGEVTQSMFPTQKLDCVDKSPKQAKSINYVGDIAQDAADTQTDFCPVLSVNVDILSVSNTDGVVGPHTCAAGTVEKGHVSTAAFPLRSGLKMTSVVTSQPPETNSWLEPKQLLFHGIEEWGLNENSVDALEKENHGSSSQTALKDLEAVGSVNEESVGRDSKKVLDSSASGKLQEEVLQTGEITSTIEEVDRASSGGSEEERLEFVEAEDSEFDSHAASFNNQLCRSHLTVPSSVKEICQISGNGAACSSTIRDCKVNSMLDSSGRLSDLEDVGRKSSLGNLVQYTMEEKCIEECCLNEKSAAALAKENQARSSSTAISNVETVQSVKEEPVRRVFTETHVSSANGQLPEEGALHIAEVISRIEEIGRVSNEVHEERPELVETECTESDSYHTSCINKSSHVSTFSPMKATSWISRNELAYTCPVTECSLNSMDFSGSWTSSGNLLQYTSEEKCIGKLMNETTDAPVQLINTVRSDGSQLIFPESNDVVSEAKQVETATMESENRSVTRPTITPNADETRNAMLEVQHFLSSSTTSVNISGSSESNGSGLPSLKKAGKSLEAQETVVYASPGDAMKRSVVRQTPNTAEICNVPPEARYFLRSTSSLDKKSGSCKTDGPVLPCSEKNCVLLEAHVDKVHAGAVDMEENVIQHKLTPNTAEIYNAPPEARYFLRSLTSHDKNLNLFKSNVTCDASSSKQSVEGIAYACEITWPKRRKLEGRSNHILATSPRLRHKPLMHSREGGDRRYNGSAENASVAIMGFPFQPSSSSRKFEMAISNAARESPVEEIHQSKKRRVTEGVSYLKAKDQAVMSPTTPLSTHVKPSFDQEDGDSKNCLKDEVGISKSTTASPNLKKYHDSEDGQDLLFVESTLEHEISKYSGYSEGITEEREMYEREKSLYSRDSIRSIHCGDVDLVACNETMPEFEGFSIGDPSLMEDGTIFNGSDLSGLTKERASLLEQLCRSTSMLTPFSRPSTKYKIHKIPDVYQSLPNGFLEHMDLNSSFRFDDVDLKQFRASEGGKLAGFSCDVGSEFYDSLSVRSHSQSIPSSSVRFGSDARKPPLTPPVEKHSQRMIPERSGVSSEKLGSNPELICFRIDENSSTTEENGRLDELEDTSPERVGSRGMKVSTNRKALVDVTSIYQNVPTLLSTSDKFLKRDSLDSVNTDYDIGTQMGVNLSLGNGHASDRKSKGEDKENHSLPVSGNRTKKAAESLRNRSSKRDSTKTIESSRSKTILEKGCKPSNIVSNISSFIPLVRQKQQAPAPAAGKRDIKVKALEAAVAAKHLEEKKEHERKMRKAAAKVERVRLEQENVRQLEHKQKQKEDERKKKEADIAVRKRQREEEERKEKERKRRCIQETRKQQREHEEKLHAEKEEKEMRRKAADEKERKRKELAEEAKRQLKSNKRSKVAGSWKATEVQPSTTEIVAGNALHGSRSLEPSEASKEANDNTKVVHNSDCLEKAIQDRISVTKGSQDLQSYEISPYRDSDDEDGEEDNRRRSKHIPLWARREFLDQILQSKRHIDPAKIFCRKSSFSLAEVLSTRVRQRPI